MALRFKEVKQDNNCMYSLQEIRELLKTGEGPDIEYKMAAVGLPRTFFETVCAFLNRDGGMILLGVEDDGTVSGIGPERVPRLKKEISDLSNNPSKSAHDTHKFD